jgi:hypothetical protein
MRRCVVCESHCYWPRPTCIDDEGSDSIHQDCARYRYIENFAKYPLRLLEYCPFCYAKFASRYVLMAHMFCVDDVLRRFFNVKVRERMALKWHAAATIKRFALRVVFSPCGAIAKKAQLRFYGNADTVLC